MKKVIFSLAIVLTQNVFCQDSIFKKNGEIIAAKVLEISDTEVKFKKTQNLDGPNYAELKSGLVRIKFENGTVDTINSKVEVKTEVATQTVSVNQQNISSRQSLMYRKVSDAEMYSIIETLPASDSKTRMKREYALMKQYQANQYLAGTLGWVIGFGVPVVTSFAVVGDLFYGNGNSFVGRNGFAVFVAGALGGAVIRTTGQVFMKINKNKRMHARKNIMTIYEGM